MIDSFDYDLNHKFQIEIKELRSEMNRLKNDTFKVIEELKNDFSLIAKEYEDKITDHKSQMAEARKYVECYKNLMDIKLKEGDAICGTISSRASKWLKSTEEKS